MEACLLFLLFPSLACSPGSVKLRLLWAERGNASASFLPGQAQGPGPDKAQETAACDMGQEVGVIKGVRAAREHRTLRGREGREDFRKAVPQEPECGDPGREGACRQRTFQVAVGGHGLGALGQG